MFKAAQTWIQKFAILDFLPVLFMTLSFRNLTKLSVLLLYNADFMAFFVFIQYYLFTNLAIM